VFLLEMGKVDLLPIDEIIIDELNSNTV
jgi:hypothetical protein